MAETDPRGQRLDPASAREEAERLVAAGLAAASIAADRIGRPARERGGPAAAGFDALGDMLFGPAGHRRHSVANDSPECCKCPVCRVIAAARRPDADVAERLATGAGNVAEGLARVLGRFAGPGGATPPGAARTTGDPSHAAPGPDTTTGPGAGAPDPAGVWAAATTTSPSQPPPPGPPATRAVAKKPMARKAVAPKATAPKATATSATAPKAVAKKAVAPKAAAPKAAARKAVAKKATVSGATGKKAVRKAAAPGNGTVREDTGQ